MSKIRIRQGAFIHEVIKIKEPRPKDIKEIEKALKGGSPRARIEKWRPHAERLKAGLDHLAMAEALIGKDGHIKNYANMIEFDICLSRSIREIENVQLEESVIPMARYGVKTKEERRQGGQNSHEMSAEDRSERNKKIQSEIDRLCRLGRTFRSARVIIGKSFKLHPDTLKKIAKNPR